MGHVESTPVPYTRLLGSARWLSDVDVDGDYARLKADEG